MTLPEPLHGLCGHFTELAHQRAQNRPAPANGATPVSQDAPGRSGDLSEAEIRADERRKLAAELERRATALSATPDPTEYIYAAAVTYREAAHIIRGMT